MRRTARAVLSFGLWLVLGFAVTLTAALALPTLVGYKTLTVISGSMEPTLETGSVVIDRIIPPLEARPGDIVTFQDPGRRRLLTHRLQSMRVEGDKAHMVTRGNANDTVERWSVPVSGEIGRVAYQVPKLGYVRALITGRNARFVILGGVLLLGFWILADVWRRP